MKIEELQIGNWVFDGDKQAQVTSITCGGVIETTRNPFSNIEHLSPIPLTTEILEKNGFKKSISPPGIHAKCYELNNKDKKYNLTIANYNKYKRLLLNVDSEDSECFNIKCDYVHELQQALKLCRIDKKIKL